MVDAQRRLWRACSTDARESFGWLSRPCRAGDNRLFANSAATRGWPSPAPAGVPCNERASRCTGLVPLGPPAGHIPPAGILAWSDERPPVARPRFPLVSDGPWLGDGGRRRFAGQRRPLGARRRPLLLVPPSPPASVPMPPRKAVVGPSLSGMSARHGALRSSTRCPSRGLHQRFR